MSQLVLGDSLVFPNAAGFGIKVNQTNPTFTWREYLGAIHPKASGPGSPTRTTFRGNVKAMAFALNDEVDLQFHLQHDFVPTSVYADSHLFWHYHWAHNGTNISGTLEITTYVTYAKGHNQTTFPAEIAALTTYNTTDIATTPQYSHRLTEIQLSSSTPSGTQLDSDDLEVDGLLLMTAKVTQLPTVTGGNLFIFQGDLHYLSSNIGTVSKAPNFYTP